MRRGRINLRVETVANACSLSSGVLLEHSHIEVRQWIAPIGYHLFSAIFKFQYSLSRRAKNTIAEKITITK